MNTAARRRDAILATSEAPVTTPLDTPLQGNGLQVTPGPDPSIGPEGTRQPPSSFTPTQSESIAQKVLSGGSSFSSSFGSGPNKADNLVTGIPGGAGGSGNPIYVTLAERE